MFITDNNSTIVLSDKDTNKEVSSLKALRLSNFVKDRDSRDSISIFQKASLIVYEGKLGTRIFKSKLFSSGIIRKVK